MRSKYLPFTLICLIFTVLSACTGQQGPTGIDGAQGETGAQGTEGSTGTVGPVGPAGENGADAEPCRSVQNEDDSYTVSCPDSEPVTIQSGEQGPQGEDGAQGPQGEDGAQGPQGTTGHALLVRSTPVEPSAEADNGVDGCTEGGRFVETGADDGLTDDGVAAGVASDGVLDNGEVDASFYACLPRDGGTFSITGELAPGASLTLEHNLANPALTAYYLSEGLPKPLEQYALNHSNQIGETKDISDGWTLNDDEDFFRAWRRPDGHFGLFYQINETDENTSWIRLKIISTEGEDIQPATVFEGVTDELNSELNWNEHITATGFGDNLTVVVHTVESEDGTLNLYATLLDAQLAFSSRILITDKLIATDDENQFDVAGLSDGFVVGYTQSTSCPLGPDVFSQQIQRFNANGDAQGTPIILTENLSTDTVTDQWEMPNSKRIFLTANPDDSLVAIYERDSINTPQETLATFIDVNGEANSPVRLSGSYVYDRPCVATAPNGSMLIQFEIGGPDAAAYALMDAQGNLIKSPRRFTEHEPAEMTCVAFPDNSFGMYMHEDESLTLMSYFVSTNGTIDPIAVSTPNTQYPVGYETPYAFVLNQHEVLYLYPTYTSHFNGHLGAMMRLTRGYIGLSALDSRQIQATNHGTQTVTVSLTAIGTTELPEPNGDMNNDEAPEDTDEDTDDQSDANNDPPQNNDDDSESDNSVPAAHRLCADDSVFGDGQVESFEACDDGNRIEFDGCSNVGGIEEGWTCNSTEPSVCTVLEGYLLHLTGTDLQATVDNAIAINQQNSGAVHTIIVQAGTYVSQAEQILDLKAAHFTFLGQVDADGASLSILDGQGTRPLVVARMNQADGVTLFKNLTFINGNSVDEGGAIDWTGIDGHKELQIDGCRFVGNSAAQSGGAVNSKGLTVIQNSHFEENISRQSYGGAFCSDETRFGTSITGSTFVRNGAGNSGGAVAIRWDDEDENTPAMPITNCLFQNNGTSSTPLAPVTFNGGAIYFYIASGALTDCRFENNQAQGNGGALFGEEYSYTSDLRGIYTGNSAGLDGGAVYANYDTHFQLTDTQITDNQAGGIAAGIFADDAFTGNNITVSNNHASEVTSDENWWGSTAGIVFNSNSESAIKRLDDSVICGNDVNGSATAINQLRYLLNRNLLSDNGTNVVSATCESIPEPSNDPNNPCGGCVVSDASNIGMAWSAQSGETCYTLATAQAAIADNEWCCGDFINQAMIDDPNSCFVAPGSGGFRCYADTLNTPCVIQ